MAFIDELRSRLKTTKRNWEKCKEEVKRAKEKESRTRDELVALEVLLNAENPKNTKTADKTLAVPMALPLTPVAEDNKAEAIRAIIREHHGLTPVQIRKLATDKGLQLKTNYVYAVLLRGKKSGRITQRNGKYFVEERDLRGEAAS